MTRRSKALNEHRPDAYVEINYVDAKRLGIEEKVELGLLQDGEKWKLMLW